MTRVIERWAEHGGTEDLPAHVDQALLMLERGVAPGA